MTTRDRRRHGRGQAWSKGTAEFGAGIGLRVSRDMDVEIRKVAAAFKTTRADAARMLIEWGLEAMAAP